MAKYGLIADRNNLQLVPAVFSLFAGQSDVLTRQVATEGLSSDEADLEDLGRNADFYIFNPDDRQD